MGRDKDAAKYWDVPRIAPTAKNDGTPNASRAEVECPCLYPSCDLIFTTPRDAGWRQLIFNKSNGPSFVPGIELKIDFNPSANLISWWGLLGLL